VWTEVTVTTLRVTVSTKRVAYIRGPKPMHHLPKQMTVNKASWIGTQTDTWNCLSSSAACRNQLRASPCLNQNSEGETWVWL
jgi:hypothetical protein